MRGKRANLAVVAFAGERRPHTDLAIDHSAAAPAESILRCGVAGTVTTGLADLDRGGGDAAAAAEPDHRSMPRGWAGEGLEQVGAQLDERIVGKPGLALPGRLIAASPHLANAPPARLVAPFSAGEPVVA